MKTYVFTGLSVLVMIFVISSPAGAHGNPDPKLTAQFTQLDQDGDGFVSAAEAKAQPELTRYMHLSAYGAFEMADINGDGHLNMVEFLAAEEDISAE